MLYTYKNNTKRLIKQNSFAGMTNRMAKMPMLNKIKGFYLNDTHYLSSVENIYIGKTEQDIKEFCAKDLIINKDYKLIYKSKELASLIKSDKTCAKFFDNIIIYPDKIMLDTQSKELIMLESKKFIDGKINISLCDEYARDYEISYFSDAYPLEPKEGMLWFKQRENKLYRFSSIDNEFFVVENVFTKLINKGLFGFAVGDRINIDGFIEDTKLNCECNIVAICDNGIIINTIAKNNVINNNIISIKKILPHLDMIAVHGNRLFGINKQKSKLYASALCECQSFYKFEGIASDSYYLKLNELKKASAIISFNHELLIFLEDGILQLEGNSPINFRINRLQCSGLNEKYKKSLIKLENNLYFLNKNGLYRYNGYLSKINEDMHWQDIEEVKSLAFGGKYFCYIKSVDDEGLYCYTPDINAWCKIASIKLDCVYASNNYAYLCKNEEMYIIKDLERADMPGLLTEARKYQTPFELITSEHRLDNDQVFFIDEIRLAIEAKEAFEIFLSLDKGEWQKLKIRQIKGKNIYIAKTHKKSCANFKIKILGKGKCKIYSINTYIHKGGIE